MATPKLYHLSVFSYTGNLIYSQQLGFKKIDEQLIQSVSSTGLNMQNSFSQSVSSITYETYTIYFKHALNFLVVVLANQANGVKHLITKMFNEFLANNVISEFDRLVEQNVRCDDASLQVTIHRIVYNIDFVSSLSGFKRDVQASTSRF